MKATRFTTFAMALGLIALFCGAASGQAKKVWPPKEIKSGGKAWGVYMKPPRLEAIPDKGVLVAEADSEEEAKKIADAYFNDPNNKFPKDLFTALKKGGNKEASDPPTYTFDLPGGKKVVVPLSNVDPKPLPKAKPPIIELAGKKAKGKLGEHNVMFDFQKGNKLVITGDLEGEGQWGLTADLLTMTTKLSVFFGTVGKDGTIKGKRVKRDGKDLLEWSATVPVAGATEDGLVGTTWRVRGSHRRVGNGFNGTCTFQANGKCRLVLNGRQVESAWSRSGNTITVSQDSKSGGPFSFDIGAAKMAGGNGEWRVSLEKQ